MRRRFIVDEEISLNESNDILKTKIYADELVKVINNTPHDKVFTIGLFGNWGSGKSSIIKTAKDTIEKENDKVKFITYDAWKYVNDSFRRMFLLKVQQELKQGQTEAMQRFYQSESVEATPKTYVSTNGLAMLCLGLLVFLITIWCLPIEFEMKAPIFSGITLIGLLITIFSGIFQKLKIQINKPIVFAPEQFEDCFREMISKALKKKNLIKNTCTKAKEYVTIGECSITNLDKLVIVIDNIDRCHNEMAYQLLTDIKTFLSDENYNVVFIIPVDDEALRHNLFSNNKSSQQCGKEKEEFLRKFFNVTIRIKPHQTTELNAYAKELSEEYCLCYNADTIAICSKEFATNPRRIIQLFNNLSSELEMYTPDFAEENETLICILLIIREEYEDFYKCIVNDYNKLINYKESEWNEKYADLSSFMRVVKNNIKRADRNVLLKILTNTDAIFDNLPYDIKKKIETYDYETTINYINTHPESRNAILNYVLKTTKDTIKSKSEEQIANSLQFVSILYISIIFTDNYIKMLDVEFVDWYDKVLDKIDRSFTDHICLFAKDLDIYASNKLKLSIINYVKSTDNDINTEFDSQYMKSVLRVFKSKDDIDGLRDFVTNLFKNIDIYTDVEYSKDQMDNLFTEELVKDYINKMEIDDNDRHSLLLQWFFEHKTNITEPTFNLFFEKVSTLIGSTLNNSKVEIILYYKFILRFLCFIPSDIIHDHGIISDLNNKLDRRNVHYNGGIHILDECKDNKDCLTIIIDFILEIYRINNKLIVLDSQVKKSQQYAKDYLYSKLMEYHDAGYLIEPFRKVIIEDEDYSSENTLKLIEYCIMDKDDAGKLLYEESVLKDKVKSLLNNISNFAVCAMVERLAQNDVLKNYFIEDIITRDTDLINKLPESLLELAVGNFNKETIKSYLGNYAFLKIIATKGTDAQKTLLIKQFTDNINNNVNIDETMSILEALEINREGDKNMIKGALQTFNTNNDDNIDKLISKFDK